MRSKQRRLEFAAVIAIVVLAGCAAGDPRFTVEAPAGFWQGLWHGMIAMVTLVIGIFSDTVRVYEPYNTGGWYDCGFLFGTISVWGGGSHQVGRRSRRREHDREWDEIGRRVETKLSRLLRAWAEAGPDEDWQEVEKKAERKLKLAVRRWADEPIDIEPIAPPRR
jgi:hypothetical protein